ncbi:MAG: AEC family transporter [Clostridia bacterium]|nr:AEC family transporter [Clostridia bacterium]
MFISVILPIIIIFSAGFAAQKALKLHIKSISTMAIYLMFPPLVFRTFYDNPLSLNYLYIFLYTVVLTGIFIIIIKAIGLWKKYPDEKQNALILAVGFMNNGNYGIPLVLFAYGAGGLDYIVPIMIFHTVLQTTIGVYYAAKGKTSFKSVIGSIGRMPMMHAIYLGIIWRALSLPMHESIYGAISLIADAAIPTVMLALGMQLAEIKVKNIEWNLMSLAVFLRLVVSPIIAFLMVWYLPIDLLLKKIMVVAAATPTAAISSMLAIQYDCNPQLVSAITLITTFLSMGTILIALLLLG